VCNQYGVEMPAAVAYQSRLTGANRSYRFVKTQALGLDIGRCVRGTERKEENNKKDY
jgi:hypothetical protein